MNIIIGERCSGKTTKLIEKSAATGAYILTATNSMAGFIAAQANRMGLYIPRPISYESYIRGFVLNPDVRSKGILIDDAALIIARTFPGITVHDIAFTDLGNVEWLEDLRKRKE